MTSRPSDKALTIIGACPDYDPVSGGRHVEKVSKAAQIPQVDKLLRHPLLAERQQHMRREVLAALTRQELDRLRSQLAGGQDVPQIDVIARTIARAADNLTSPGLRKILNGTGVALNTNLGRAPLPPESIRHLEEVCTGYTNLEIELSSGKRGERGARVEDLLVLLTGCEAAIVVNNNAAAVLLTVNTLARNKEVLISRGELIEIGGSFRLPEVIVSSGGVLKEVGTTNRTRLSDYQQSIGENTGLLLKCHRSNFQVSGFTEEATIEELVTLAADANLPLVEDLGSGIILDPEQSGLYDEPTVQSVLRAGCSLVTFSGDKLLGGPQAGIIAGHSKLVARLRKNPLYRALRADKMILSVLESVLTLYLCNNPEKKVPVLRMLTAPASELEIRAQDFVARANRAMNRLACQTVHTSATAGGGSLPGRMLDSYGISIESPLSANLLAKRLRGAVPPIVAIVHDDKLIIDFRTIAEDEECLLLEGLIATDRNLDS